MKTHTKKAVRSPFQFPSFLTAAAITASNHWTTRPTPSPLFSANAPPCLFCVRRALHSHLPNPSPAPYAPVRHSLPSFPSHPTEQRSTSTATPAPSPAICRPTAVLQHTFCNSTTQYDTLVLYMQQSENTLPELVKQARHIAGGVELVRNKQDTTFLLSAEGGGKRSPECGREFG